MELSLALDLARNCLLITFVLSAPLLLTTLLIGVLVSIFQAVTQINEQTLTFVPKVMVMAGVLLIMMPWMLRKMIDYTANLFALLPQVVP